MQNRQKLLVDSATAGSLLSISSDDLEWLVDTQQLSPIYVRGRRLFSMEQLEELVRLYKTVQSRGNNEQEKSE